MVRDCEEHQDVLPLIALPGGAGVAKLRREFLFLVQETSLVDPDRVAEGLNVWADCLARRPAATESAAIPRVSQEKKN